MTDLFEHAASVKVYPPGVPIEVCDKFEELALMLHHEHHYRRYSADGILHRIRWHFQIDRGRRGFKCNNNWTADLARWFLKFHPDMPGFFELREKVGNAAEWIDNDE
jgi:hypothetical protein